MSRMDDLLRRLEAQRAERLRLATKFKDAAAAGDVSALEVVERQIKNLDIKELNELRVDHPSPDPSDAAEASLRRIHEELRRRAAERLWNVETERLRNAIQRRALGDGALGDSRSGPCARCSFPSAAQFALILLSRKRRDDVLNDLWDWYPGWIKEHHGRRVWANFACFVKIAAAFFGQGLDVLYRIGEVVGKFRGAK